MEKIKQHFKENKKTYIVGVSAFAAGAITILIYKNKAEVIAGMVKVRQGVAYKSPVEINNITEVHLERRGHPGYVIKCNETGEIFASQNRAAEALGLSPSNLAAHLKGKKSSVKGLTFERIGEAIA